MRYKDKVKSEAIGGIPRPSTVGPGVEVSAECGLLVAGFGVSALGAVAGRVGDLDEAPVVEHKPRPPAVGDEPPRAVDLAEKEGCDHIFLSFEAEVSHGELLCRRFGGD